MKSAFFSNNQKYYTILLAMLACFAFLVLQFWHITWDDSAITLGFSRNLIKYGDIIPSQYSERVEGYSTFLWMVFNSILFLFGLNEDQVLFSAKLASTVLTFINILMVAAIVRKKISNPLHQILILFFYIFNGVTLGAAVFGMETALYATLMILSYLLFAGRNRNPASYAAFVAASSLLILTRHEGVVFLAPFGLALLLDNPRALLRESCVYVWAAVFVIYHLWHFYYFGEIVTNPMIAKTHWPYQHEANSLRDSFVFFIGPFVEFALRYMLVLIFALYGFFMRGANLAKQDESNLFLWINLVGFIVMLLTNNYFPTSQRASYPALPFILILLLSKAGNLSFPPLSIKFIPVFIVLLFAALISEFGMLLSFRSPEYIHTLDKVRVTSHAATLLQKFLKKDVVTFGTHDMGGLLLYEGDGKRIIDFGLLCNKRLAEFGYMEYDGLEEYLFQEENPDIIYAHQGWLVPLVRTDSFFEMYIPIQVITNDGDRMFFVKQDLIQNMKIIPYTGSNPDIQFHDIFVGQEDKYMRDALLKFGEYVRIDLRNSRP